jgi:hypothetical protein
MNDLSWPVVGVAARCYKDGGICKILYEAWKTNFAGRIIVPSLQTTAANLAPAAGAKE